MKNGVSGAVLKWVAIITMLIDHIAFEVFGKTQIMQDLALQRSIYNIGRHIGRMAFPIFCFLLVEGFIYTRDAKKYALRLGLFAVISEIPYDLMVCSKPFDFSRQNVFLGLFISMLMLIAIKKYGNRFHWTGIIVAASALLCYLLKCDYYYLPPLLIALFYWGRDNRLRTCICGFILISIFSLTEVWAVPAFILMYLYNGKRGMQPGKLFFYAFYPVHMLLIVLFYRLVIQ